jgi:hypothetical protein
MGDVERCDGWHHCDSPWINEDNRVVHPYAPRGLGGPGRFRYGSSLGLDLEFYPPVSHHQSAEARYHLLSDAEKYALSGKWPNGKAPRNPPPVVVPGKEKIRGAVVIIKADGTTDDPAVKGAAITTPLFGDVMIPGTHSDHANPDPNKQRVDRLTGPLPVITITIQTVYGKGAAADMISGYGRGTTLEDIVRGDITLGFHESCHREDFLIFLRSVKKPPVFAGRAGMTQAQYDQARRNFAQAYSDYHDEMLAFSTARTDQVGMPTKREYEEAKGKKMP